MPQATHPTDPWQLVIYLCSDDPALCRQVLASCSEWPAPPLLLCAVPPHLLPGELPGFVRLLSPPPQRKHGEHFFDTLLSAQIGDAIGEDALVLRIEPDAASSRARRRVQAATILQTLDYSYVQALREATLGDSPVGLIAPIGTPRAALRDMLDPATRARLAGALGVDATAIDAMEYFPAGLYFLSARGLRTLREAKQHRAAAAGAFLRALELGITALLHAAGLSILNANPSSPRPTAALLQNYVGELLQRPDARHRHREYAAATQPALSAPAGIKYIAYYLPQFHAIPENDQWWGRGFTEWTNVTKAVPRFPGHNQPQLPSEQGFYDLTDVAVMRDQVALARNAGLHGFCFYFYWFNGRTLLETPLRNFLASPDLDFPFCLCWANENWTRRWDGQENEVLIEQAHSPRDDLAFLRHVEPYLRDPRYIRIDGKPVLLVYRATLLDDPAATARRWRAHAEACGLGGVYLVAVNSFDIGDPRPLGFDAAVEFPPHQLDNMPPINDRVGLVDPAFAGEIYDYRETVLLAAEDKLGDAPPPPYPVLRGVMTGWDNDARRPGRGRIFHHATPSAYAVWLEMASRWTRRHNPPSHQFVFINAWNEWAEGAHLEPDRHFGHAWLAATADLAARHGGLPGQYRDGSLRALRNHLPAPIAANLLDVGPEPYLQRLQALGRTPRLHVVVHAWEVGYPLLLTLINLSEQHCRDFALTVIAPEPCPESWLPPHLPQAECSIGTPLDGTPERIAATGTASHVVLLEAGDRLLPNSLLALQVLLAEQPAVQLVSADELWPQGEGYAMHLYPVADLERLRCGAPRPRPLALARPLLAGLDGLLSRNEAAEHEVRLRCADAHGIESLVHLQELLVLRDGTPPTPNPEGLAAKADATHRHLQGLGIAAEVSANHQGTELVVSYLPEDWPLVSIVIPTHDQQAALQRCLEGLLGQTDYPAFEIIILNHLGADAASAAFARGLPAVAPEQIRCFDVEGAFNFAAFCNAGAQAARGECLLFLNDDTAVLHPEWLKELVAQTAQPGVAIAGARQLFPDGRIQHAGITLGLNGAMDFAWNGSPMDEGGWQGELRYARDVAAVTGACLMVRREVFDALGGFDTAFGLGFADADLCLRARALNGVTRWTPHATLMHEGGRSLRALAGEAAASADTRYRQERELFCQRWHARLAHDPGHHPALSLRARRYRPEPLDELQAWPLPWHPLPRVFALPADQAGSGYYRVAQPVEHVDAAKRIQGRVAGGYPLPVALERLGVDTLFTQRQVDDAQLAALQQLRKETELSVVVDFDDLLTAVPAGSLHREHIWPDIAQRVEACCRLAHRITVSTPALAEAMRGLHDDIRVIPNAIDPARWAKPGTHSAQQRQSRRLRVGWAGGLSHAPDLALIAPVVEALADEVDWIFFGMCLDTMQPHLCEFHRGVPIERYPETLAALDLDLAIAPLAANRFNECKSNLRLLEYGALGIPVLASDVLPYQCGLPVTLLPNKPEHWRRAIRERLEQREALRAEGAQLRAAVETDWSIDGFHAAWLAAWTGKS